MLPGRRGKASAVKAPRRAKPKAADADALQVVAYRPLVEILHTAAARNFAYWEGTDIDVTQARPDWLPQRPSPQRNHEIDVKPTLTVQ